MCNLKFSHSFCGPSADGPIDFVFIHKFYPVVVRRSGFLFYSHSPNVNKRYNFGGNNHFFRRNRHNYGRNGVFFGGNAFFVIFKVL
jgi:hypothetical protein